MLGDLQVAYLGVEVPHTSALGTFLTDVVGLIPGEAPNTWCNDRKSRRIIATEGSAADATFVGFEAADADAWAASVARLEHAGYPATVATGHEANARRVEQLASVDAPWGVRVEVAHGLADAAHTFASPLVAGGFVTDDKGFGHVVFATTAFDESHRFVTEGLGLRQTDWVETEIAAGIELEIRFYHCNPRHHSLALARAPFDLPQRLHHFMVEVADRDDVGYAFDRAWNANCVIASGLGHHPNDQMFSFYVASPAGFQVEIGHGARLVTETWPDNRRYDRISSWGHQPLPAR
ncbi:MAG TPA: VOC family protein [Acidimicrobiales bacterium]|jgi:2,3-dihydroxybiphenyl 1,2-dioxygenase